MDMDCRNIVVETPKGSAQKYSYDSSMHFFKLKKILPPGMVFPYDFGFIPETKGEDGDPLDVIVVSEFQSFPGCVIRCRIIGAIKAEQSKKSGKDKMIRNDRFIAIPEFSTMFEKISSIDDLPKKILHELEEFFVNYNHMQGKEYRIIDKVSHSRATHLIDRAKDQ
jgi:inorganic pyrophosphatase